MLRQRHIVLAVTGGIAAYKACELARLLLKNGATVQVAMTAAATRFVAPLTFEALTGRPVARDLFRGEELGSGHLDLVRQTDLMVIAPATANCLSKLANGLADDLISTAVLALQAPLLICPAMNPRMWQHAAVQENIAKLHSRGVEILSPDSGNMAHPLEEPGPGRLPEPSAILEHICQLLPPRGSLSGFSLVVTAGPTREALDPVRFLSNDSSGIMGFALATEARRRGAEVYLITGPVALPTPVGVQRIQVQSAEELKREVQKRLKKSQALLMAAAPADFKPQTLSKTKIKKEAFPDQNWTLELVKTPDILADLGKAKGHRRFVGFALETEKGLESARRKLQAKNLDLIILNHPHPQKGAGIGTDLIQGTLLSSDGAVEEYPILPKEKMANLILDRLETLLKT